MDGKKAIIAGAGITGLSAGWKLSGEGYGVTLFEREDHIGGLAHTFQHGKHRLDFGPHKLFTVMGHVMREIRTLIGDEMLTIQKRSRIRLKGRYLNYPVGVKDLFMGINPVIGMRCGLSYAITALKNLRGTPRDASYRDWITNRFGVEIFDLVFGPYAQKIWGDPDTLSKELAETRVAVPDLFQMIKQMVLGLEKDGVVMSADEFFYPRDGIVTLANRMAERVEKNGGTISLARAITKIHHQNNRITGLEIGDTSMTVREGDVFVSTIPLKVFSRLLSPSPPNFVVEAIGALTTRNLILLYLVIDKERVSLDNWIFFPGEEYIFNRIFEQKGFSSYMIPREETVLCLEITCGSDDPMWHESKEILYKRVIAQLEECGLVKRQEVKEYFMIRLKDVYQIYDRDYRKHKNLVMRYCDGFENFYTVGRHGAFNYVGMADCMDMGFRVAAHIVHSPTKSREAMRDAFESYVVID